MDLVLYGTVACFVGDKLLEHWNVHWKKNYYYYFLQLQVVLVSRKEFYLLMQMAKISAAQ